MLLIKSLSNLQKGFTLLELVMGIIVFSVALTIITTAITPQASKSIEPIYQVRATELAQSLMNEISGMAYDENSDRRGGNYRCGDADYVACSTTLGPDGSENRTNYDDVDDYVALNGLDGASLLDATGNPRAGLYSGYTVNISVVYDGNFDGSSDGSIANHKLITVSVTTPKSEQLIFSTYRSNY